MNGFLETCGALIGIIVFICFLTNCSEDMRFLENKQTVEYKQQFDQWKKTESENDKYYKLTVYSENKNFFSKSESIEYQKNLKIENNVVKNDSFYYAGNFKAEQISPEMFFKGKLYEK